MLTVVYTTRSLCLLEVPNFDLISVVSSWLVILSRTEPIRSTIFVVSSCIDDALDSSGGWPHHRPLKHIASGLGPQLAAVLICIVGRKSPEALPSNLAICVDLIILLRSLKGKLWMPPRYSENEKSLGQNLIWDSRLAGHEQENLTILDF